MDTLPVLIAIAGTIPVLMRVVRDFLAGRRVGRGRSLKIEVNGQTLELTGVDDERQQQVVEQWLERLSEEKP